MNISTNIKNVTFHVIHSLDNGYTVSGDVEIKNNKFYQISNGSLKDENNSLKVVFSYINSLSTINSLNSSEEFNTEYNDYVRNFINYCKDYAQSQLIEEPIHEPTEEEIAELQKLELELSKNRKIYQLLEYDSSSDVNLFYYNDSPFWIDKATRVGLVNSTQMEKLMGRENTTLILDDVVLTLPCDIVLQMLAALEVYAKDCYNVTANHRIAIENLLDKESVEFYDFTTGYPEKLRF